MPKRLSLLRPPPPLPIIYEQTPTDSTASLQSNPFLYDEIPDWPLRTHWPLPAPPPQVALPPRPEPVPWAPPRIAPKRPNTRPAERITPLPDKPQRRRDFSDIYVAWQQYQDKSQPLSQSGNLQAFHDDLMRRPPGYNPERRSVRRRCPLWCF